MLVLALGSGPTVLANAPTPLTVTFTANDLVYNRLTATTVSTCTITSVIDTNHPDVHCDSSVASGTFADKNVNVGPAKAVIGSGFVLGGTDAGFYIIETVVDSSANITKRPLTVTATGDNRVYDQMTAATVTLTDDRIAGDVFTDGYTAASFIDKNVANGKAVSVSGISISGTDAGNYSYNTTAAATANITKLPITVTAAGIDKVYDGTNVATVTLSNTALAGDTVTNAYGAATFTADKNVGNGKAVGVTGISIAGIDAGNYSYNTTASTTANITKLPITVTAVSNVKVADGPVGAIDGLSAGTLPTISSLTPLATGDTAVGLRETYLDPTANTGKTLRPFGTVTDGNSGNNYDYTFVDITTGQIRPAPVASIVFTTQPIDTQVSTPIYNVCVPSGSSAPCALSTVATPSTAVKVTARDQFGNLAGPGAPGADLTTNPVTVSMNKTNAAGVSVSANVATSNGVASFGNGLTIVTLESSVTLYAAAVGTASANAISGPIRIVDRVVACGTDTCINSIGTVSVHASYGKIVATSGLFFGTGRNVSLTTQFVPGAQTQLQCTSSTNSKVTNSKTIGDATDLRVIGLGVTASGPTTRMLIVIPKNVLKASGVLSRGTSSFNVCLGALYIGSSATPTRWTAKNPATSGTQPANPVVDSGALGGLTRYWGVPLDCSDSRIKDTNGKNTSPCISLRTKLKSDIFNALGAEAAALMNDSDIAIIIDKPSDWDGKGGIY